jgi:hypothetical protein
MTVVCPTHPILLVWEGGGVYYCRYSCSLHYTYKSESSIKELEILTYLRELNVYTWGLLQSQFNVLVLVIL